MPLKNGNASGFGTYPVGLGDALVSGGLHVNAEASNGQVAVEILDAESMVLLEEHSGTFTDDSIDTVLAKEIPEDRSVGARFRLKNAGLYAFLAQ